MFAWDLVFVYLNVFQVMKERTRDFCIKYVLWFSILFHKKKKICLSFDLDITFVSELNILSTNCGPAFFSRASPLEWARLAFLFLLENHLKKRFGVATYFCFILKGKNKIRKKNPKCDS